MGDAEWEQLAREKPGLATEMFTGVFAAMRKELAGKRRSDAMAVLRTPKRERRTPKTERPASEKPQQQQRTPVKERRTPSAAYMRRTLEMRVKKANPDVTEAH